MTILITSNTLAIAQSVSSKYNGLLFDYGAITGRKASQDKNNYLLARLFNLLSTVKKYACGGNHNGNLRTGNHKRQLVRSKVRTKVRTENSPLNCELNDNKIATRISQPNKNNGTITVIKNRGRSANYLPDRLIFSRQALMTQAEKLLFSFCDNSSICFINSWGNLIFFSLEKLFSLPVAILNLNLFNYLYIHYTLKRKDKKGLTCKYTTIYNVSTPKLYFRLNTTIPRSAGTLSRDLTKTIHRR